MSRPFSEIRLDALSRWKGGRVDEHDEPWECRWVTGSLDLPHTCTDPDCEATHVSLYCSFNDLAEQLVDLLQDKRCDKIELGVDREHGLIISPWADVPNGDASKLFRWYGRLLWGAEMLLDDLEHLRERALGKDDHRKALSKGAPLGINRLRGFLNNVVKHGAKDDHGLHCWNHHAEIYFEDSGYEPADLDHLIVFDVRARIGAFKYNAVSMPKLGEVVDTLTTALQNLDGDINNELVLTKLASESYGGCG